MKPDVPLNADLNEEPGWAGAASNTAPAGEGSKDNVLKFPQSVNSHFDVCPSERPAQPMPGTKVPAPEMDAPAFNQRSDADISESAEQALAWTSSLPAAGVKVMVAKGWITLSGELDWEYQRKFAERAVRHLMGVAGVSDEMTLAGGIVQQD